MKRIVISGDEIRNIEDIEGLEILIVTVDKTGEVLGTEQVYTYASLSDRVSRKMADENE